MDPLILERTDAGTVIRSGGNGQRLTIPRTLPVLPVRNLVVFPGTVIPLAIGRPRSKAMLDEVMPDEKLIGVVTQRRPEIEDPTPEQVYGVGVVCAILKLFRLADGSQSILVHGVARFRIERFAQMDPFPTAIAEVLEDRITPGAPLDALVNSVRQQAERVIDLSPNAPDEAKQVLANIPGPSALADFLAANLSVETAEKQALLEELDVEQRLRLLTSRLANQLDVLELQSEIQSQVKDSIDKNQRRYFLQEQLKAIRKELGEESGGGAEVESLRQRLEAARPPEAVMKEATRELQRLESIPSASPEYGVIRTWLSLIAELPWSAATQDKIDLTEAQAILDRDHHGLEKVKRRIVEHLAVRKLKPEGGGAILCFVGPPGVGKTSLGRSIAESMGRRFIRVALGGVRDESEIRGHRRTYIGAMPGRVIAELRKAGSRNPVMMLDEVDKLGADFRGDPASALLEVLDPAQNSTFTDHYLDVPFDLSAAMFIATANTMDAVPGPLRDRMEIIEIPGYTTGDKMDIARRYLAPRQLDAHGLQGDRVRIADVAIRLVIESYTREAGVRNLDRALAALARATAAQVVAGREGRIEIDARRVREVLGPERFEPELAARTALPGVATGLAWTPVGGDILFIEAAAMPGKGAITLTGQIGDVMKESATAAFSLVRSRCESLGIDARRLSESDIHIHVPAGAVPKDGPSAGVAMFVALASLLLNRAVRADVAMTGEITLRGLVLPIGGLKEKALAARRAGLREVIVPRRNEKDMPEVPREVRDSLDFRFVATIDEALAIALRPATRPKPPRRPARRAKKRR